MSKSHIKMEFDNDTAELELDINAGEADLGFMILKMIYQYVYYVETNAKMKCATLKMIKEVCEENIGALKDELNSFELLSADYVAKEMKELEARKRN